MVSQIIKTFICIVTVQNVFSSTDALPAEPNTVGLVSADQYEVTFYDLKTGVPFLGELVGGPHYDQDNATNLAGLAVYGFNGFSCDCSGFECSCCAGVKVNAIRLDKKVCFKFAYDPKDLGIKMSLMLDNRQIYSKQVSARNPPPVCLSIPNVPLLKFCVRFSDLSLKSKNLRTCIDFEAKILFKRVLKLHFKCVEIGANGIHVNFESYPYALPIVQETEELGVPDEVVLKPEDLEPLPEILSQPAA